MEEDQGGVEDQEMVVEVKRDQEDLLEV